MIAQSPYTLTVSTDFDNGILLKNCWLIILHSSRIPPHVGIMINGSYSSLTIKGHELDIKAEVLLKTISQKKIEALAVQLVKQPVFSLDYQKEVFEHYIQQFTKVQANEASCLSPVKLFLQEFYALSYSQHELLFEIIERLKQNSYIYNTVGFNVANKLTQNELSLPMYTNKQLQEVIEQETSSQTL
ncbi:MAG: hypothetical protein V4506_02965 [Bacteroidota bacterium]